MFTEATPGDKAEQEIIKASGMIPSHIAIIMDGNGRWAKGRGLPRISGHKAGVDSVRDIVKASAQLGVKYLTLYTFSTENWNRPQSEVSTLMKLLVKVLRDELQELHDNNVKLQSIGDIDALPGAVKKVLLDSIERTKNNSGLVLILALSYSGRWEITNACRQIAYDAKNGLLNPEDLTENQINKYLTTKGVPDPELLIRTSGEMRVSNFLLWQIAYSEIFISTVYWPDFRRKYLYEAIRDFQKRERRFGKVSEQIAQEHKGNIE